MNQPSLPNRADALDDATETTSRARIGAGMIAVLAGLCVAMAPAAQANELSLADLG
jgi:hypothetical protein